MGVQDSLGKGASIRQWLCATALLLLLAVAMPARAQGAHRSGAAPQEVIVKLREGAGGQGIAISNESAVARAGESLRRKYHPRDVRPLVGDFERQRTALHSLRQKDAAALTPRERHLLRRQRRAWVDGDGSDLGRIYRITAEAGQDVGQLLEACRQDPDVEYAELSHPISICMTPNDPLYEKQWALATIGAAEAWDTCQGSDDVVVAVIDTGTDYDHRDLQGNLWCNEAELHGLAGVDDDGNGYIDDVYGCNIAYNNGDPMDDHGHGTHCAGIVAAVGNNGTDTAGVCWNCRIMTVKILDAAGDGTTADAAPAICYAVANGADIISGSWGGREESQAVKDAIAYARRQGVIIVAAAGNEDSDLPFYPAAYPEVVAVAATDAGDKRWYLSNFGSWVDLAAPGRDILSLQSAGAVSNTGQSVFTTRMSGTSMAAPCVAGACALLLAANPLLTCEEVEQAVISTGDTIATGVCSSNRRLNVAKALRAAIPATGTVRFDRPVYSQGQDISILVADWDLRDAVTQSVVIGTDGGDQEVVNLVETGQAKGVLCGTIAGERGIARMGDGRLQLEDGAGFAVDYLDAADESGTARSTQARAHADYQAPTLVETTVDVNGPVAEIALTTSEPTRAEIRYGGGPALVLKARGTELTARHTIRITGLAVRTTYYYDVVLVDEAGNETPADNEGAHYSFMSGGDFVGFRVPSMYSTIQAAIDDAWSGDTIWVADGTYSGPGNIEIDFQGKAITLRSENGPQSCIIDCRGRGRGFYFHKGEGGESIVDGFTITHGGNVDYGAGIRCVASSPTIRNCVLAGNWAGQYGGALCNSYGAGPVVENCTFEHNICSSSRIYGRGGAIANRHDGRPVIQDCRFIENSAGYTGGAIANFDSSAARIIRCTFVGNSTQNLGGAVGHFDSSGAEYADCVFSANTARNDGGAVHHQSKGDVTLTNCILYANRADDKGAAVNTGVGLLTLGNCTISGNIAGVWCGGVRSSGGDAHIENSILWANADAGQAGVQSAQVGVTAGAVRVNYCCVEGLTGTLGGIGNIASDPLFVNSDVGDFHLKSQGWRWWVGRGIWVHDSATSPCIDAGDPSLPLGDEPTVVPDDPNRVPADNTRIDMGAFGGTAEASLAPPGWMLRSDPNDDVAETRDLASQRLIGSGAVLW